MRQNGFPFDGARLARVAAVALCFAALVALAAPVLGAPPKQTTWTAEAARTDVRPGETVLVRLRLQIEPGWHVYSMTTPPGGPMPLSISIEPTAGIEPAGPALQPKPKNKFDQNFQVDTEVFEGTVELAVPVKVTEQAEPGPRTVKGTASFQVCDPQQCIPGKFAFEAPITVEPGAARAGMTSAEASGLVAGTAVTLAQPKGPSASSPPAAPDTAAAPNIGGTAGDAADVARARSEGLWSFLWLSVYMGFLSLLTPCVFPMIPITVSYFTKAEGHSRARGIGDAAVYSVSIIVTFTILGLLATLLFGASGIRDLAANPWINILLASIFIGLALNLFGFYEIVIPSSVLTPMSRVSEKGGFVGTLLMGVTFTLTSFTCTMPFVGALLVSTAQGDWMWPIVGMLGYSIAFAIPFFFLALFPRLLSSLPKAGGWMVSVKVVMGFLELAAAVKFISNVDLVWGTQKLTREAFLSIWIALAFVTAFYLLGKVRLPHERPVETIGVLRMLFSTAFLAIAFYLFTGLMGYSLGELEAFMPPISSQQTGAMAAARGAPHGGELTWEKNYDVALASARQSGKPIFIDFTGYSCTNCRWMEKNIFPSPEVRAELENYERVQLFTDGQGPEYDRNREMQETRFNTVALPLYVVLDPISEKEIARVEGLTREAGEFAKFLRGSRELASVATDGLQARLGAAPTNR